jgi:ribonuclease HIII
LNQRQSLRWIFCSVSPRACALLLFPVPDKAITLYTTPVTPAQAAKLRALLREEGYKFETRPYTLYFAQKDKLTIAVYEKGPKLVAQGRGTEDFVKFRLEPEILGEAKLGYEEVLNPEMFEPHFGIDESGKGDFFGPLVIAGVYVDRDLARHSAHRGERQQTHLVRQGIRDLALMTGNLEPPKRGYRDPNATFFPENWQPEPPPAWGHARSSKTSVSCDRVPACA